ncbi:unnamed protein product [Symbiodinium natans]|uniref:Methyl-accepting chemotaxis protein n=1 Tax=Symbiodinium natans TaxID=878477 RepID=A0A812JRX5_9DINO|nr:unnamed protein product [Symbiodinium natans]
MRWPRFWTVLLIISAIVGVSVYNVSASDASVKVHTRESLLDLTKTYAGEMARQVRTSASSVQALEAIIRIDEMGISAQNFDSLADTLIHTYQGISNLQLAPSGQIERIYPLKDDSQEHLMDKTDMVGT